MPSTPMGTASAAGLLLHRQGKLKGPHVWLGADAENAEATGDH